MSLSDAARAVNAAHEHLDAAERRLFQALAERRQRPGRQPAEHGTRAGYRAHQRGEEWPCHACVVGNAWEHRRDQKRQAS